MPNAPQIFLEAEAPAVDVAEPAEGAVADLVDAAALAVLHHQWQTVLPGYALQSALLAAGAAEVIEQSDLTGERLSER